MDGPVHSTVKFFHSNLPRAWNQSRTYHYVPGGGKSPRCGAPGQGEGGDEAPHLSVRQMVLAFLPTPAIVRNAAWHNMGQSREAHRGGETAEGTDHLLFHPWVAGSTIVRPA